MLPNRSIPLPKLEADSIIEKDYIHTIVKFNAPSGTKYHITNQLNIGEYGKGRRDNWKTKQNIFSVPIRHDDAEVDEAAYITFTEPNGRTYDISIDAEDGHPFLGIFNTITRFIDICIAFLITISVEKKLVENYFAGERLHSFVGPNRILYQIDHKNESDHEVPVLGKVIFWIANQL